MRHVVIKNTPELELHLCRAEDVKEVLDKVSGLELVYDSANMILVGEGPLEYLKTFEGRIGYVHIKDYRPTPPGGLLVEYAENGAKMSTAPVGTELIDKKALWRSWKK